MKKLMTGSMAIGLLFAVASCGSDSKSSSTTTAETTISTDASTADTAVTGDTAAAAAGDVDTSGLSDVQAQAYTIGLDGAANAGVALDAACYKAIVAQLSDADAQLIVDAGPDGSPTLSAEGEALGAQVLSTCVATPTS